MISHSKSTALCVGVGVGVDGDGGAGVGSGGGGVEEVWIILYVCVYRISLFLSWKLFLGKLPFQYLSFCF